MVTAGTRDVGARLQPRRDLCKLWQRRVGGEAEGCVGGHGTKPSQGKASSHGMSGSESR